MFELASGVHFWLTLALFAVVFVGIFTEIVDKGILAGIGAALCVVLGLATEGEAGTYIDFQTLSLLLGMMAVVSVASMAGLFEHLSVSILKKTGGAPLLIFVLFMVLTLLLSSFLNNVTTVLIMLPLSIQIARGIGLNPRPFVLGEIFFANIGGLLTLIGDPVNSIVGSAAGLGMLDFMTNLSIPVFIIFLVTMVYLYLLNKPQFKSIRSDFSKVLHNQLVIRHIDDKLKAKNFKKRYMIRSAAALAMTIVAMLFAEQLGLTPGAIALIGAVVTLIVNHKDIDMPHLFSEIEWSTLFFYMGLFVMVGTVEKTGALDMLATSIDSLNAGPVVLIGLLLIMTGVVSAFVDNIPFVTVMIPIIRTLQENEMFAQNPDVLWWALSLGAVLGGMASPFGSSANIVAIGVAHKAGFKVATPYYLKYSLFVSCAGLLISFLYLVFFYDL